MAWNIPAPREPSEVLKSLYRVVSKAIDHEALQMTSVDVGMPMFLAASMPYSVIGYIDSYVSSHSPFANWGPPTATEGFLLMRGPSLETLSKYLGHTKD